MTDSSSLMLPNSIALTSDLQFNLLPSAARSRNYRASILPTNKNSFDPQDTCIIYIPGGRRGSYLDVSSSYMRFTIKNMDTTNAFALDGNGCSIINRIDIFHGGALLESIQNYNILANYILDIQSPVNQRYGLSNIYGFDSLGDRSGATIAASGQLTCCMPIFSGVVGVLNSKMLALGLLSDDIRLEITFESSAVGVCAAAGTPAFKVIDFQLELSITELSDEGENMVRSIANPDEPIYFHGTSWRHYTASIPASQSGSYATLVPARFASLKQIAVLPICSTSSTSATSYSIGSRTNCAIDSYFFRVGASIIPNKPVVLNNINNTGGYGESYAQLLTSWHALHSVSHSSVLGTEYNVNDAAIANTNVIAQHTGANSYKNGFAIAQEMESFSNRSDILLSGYNTLSSQIFFEANINATGPTTAYTLHFFAWYDHILVLERGLLSVKF
jgi:hypothetical protein